MEKDSLYNLFRKKFKNPSKNEMDWVQPDDMIFENVLKNLDNDDDQRKGLFWMKRYGLIIVLLGIVPFLYSALRTSDNRETIKKEVATNPLMMNEDNRQLDNNKRITTTNQQTVSVDHSDLPAQLNLVSKSNNQPDYSNIEIRSNTDVNSAVLAMESGHQDHIGIENSNNIQALGPQVTSEEVSESIASNEALEQLERTSTIGQIPNRATTDAQIGIAMLTSKLAYLDVGFNAPKLPALAEIVANPDSKSLKQSIFVSGGYSSSIVSHPTEKLSNEMIMTGHDERRSGWNLSVGYEKQLTDRWSFQSFISYNHINMESLTTGSIQYDSNNEYLAGGMNMYQTDLNLFTPTTGFTDNVEFVIEDVMMHDEDMMTNRLNINQGISLLSTNVGVSYKLLGADKFNISVGMSGGLDFIIRNHENMKVELMMEDQMLFEKDKEWVNHKGINRIGLNFGINLRANWKLSDQYSLFISPIFRRSITTVRSGDLLQEKSYFNVYQFTTGVSYQF